MRSFSKKSSTLIYEWMNEWMKIFFTFQQIYIFTREINIVGKNYFSTRKEKFYLHFLIVKHKQSPEGFLPENKMRET